MRNKIILLSLIASLIATPAFANGAGSSKEESVGVGVGAAIGAIAGGPVGMIIGAAFGAKVGDEINERNTEVDSLSSSLNGSKSRVSQLEGDIDALNSEIDGLGVDLQRMKDVSRPELLSLMKAGIEMDLLFRTDEYVLADATGDRLKQLAVSLAAMPDIKIQLDAFADERGDEVYNQELSVKRAEHVRDVLVTYGFPAARINVEAHGESPAIDENIDSYAFERKVSLTLYVEDNPRFAANPMQN
jgi:outer membrane protein OmpA-like peptidoglycan-associated protein